MWGIVVLVIWEDGIVYILSPQAARSTSLRAYFDPDPISRFLQSKYGTAHPRGSFLATHYLWGFQIQNQYVLLLYFALANRFHTTNANNFLWPNEKYPFPGSIEATHSRPAPRDVPTIFKLNYRDQSQVMQGEILETKLVLNRLFWRIEYTDLHSPRAADDVRTHLRPGQHCKAARPHFATIPDYRLGLSSVP